MKATALTYLTPPYSLAHPVRTKHWRQLSLYMPLKGYSAPAHWIDCQQVVYLPRKVSARWLNGHWDELRALGFYGTYRRLHHVRRIIHQHLPALRRWLI